MAKMRWEERWPVAGSIIQSSFDIPKAYRDS